MKSRSSISSAFLAVVAVLVLFIGASVRPAAAFFRRTPGATPSSLFNRVIAPAGGSRTARFSRESGKCKFFDTTKGFGFIVPNNGGEDVFVHQTAIHADGFRSLADGEDLEFEVRIDENTGKRVASNVTGPEGAYVKGAQKKPKPFGNDGY